jgi:hypothetical protein
MQCAIKINGSCQKADTDGSYIECKFKGRSQVKRSRIAYPFRSWESAFGLDVLSVNRGERLIFKLKQHNMDGKDKTLETWKVPISEIGFGKIYAKSYGSDTDKFTLDLRLQCVAPLAEPFVEKSFVLPKLQVVVIEVVNIQPTDVSLFPSLSCDVKLRGDQYTESTAKINRSLTPQWCEEMNFWVMDLDSGKIAVDVLLLDHTGDSTFRVVGSARIEFEGLMPGVTVEEWYVLQREGKDTDLKVNIAAQLIVGEGTPITARQCINTPQPGK